VKEKAGNNCLHRTNGSIPLIAMHVITLWLWWFAALAMTLSVGVQAQHYRELVDIPFGTVAGKALLVDLYLPEANNPPLVIYVHGGIWRNGDKSAGAAMALRLINAGFAVASLDFRQSTEAPFPANVHDIKAAVRFLRAHAGDYGYNVERG
jgi:acetyl esterase/lipase